VALFAELIGNHLLHGNNVDSLSTMDWGARSDVTREALVMQRSGTFRRSCLTNAKCIEKLTMPIHIIFTS